MERFRNSVCCPIATLCLPVLSLLIWQSRAEKNFEVDDIWDNFSVYSFMSFCDFDMRELLTRACLLASFQSKQYRSSTTTQWLPSILLMPIGIILLLSSHIVFKLLWRGAFLPFNIIQSNLLLRSFVLFIFLGSPKAGQSCGVVKKKIPKIFSIATWRDTIRGRRRLRKR